MDISLNTFLNKFFNFKIFNKRVIIPYWVNKLDKQIYGPYGGKGRPEQIKQATIEVAEKAKIDLRQMSSEEIHEFMKKSRIGLDCSGFVYQVADFLDHYKGGDGIENSIIGTNGTGITKTNADALTNDLNTLPVEKVEWAKVGDFIRFDNGRHIAIVVDVLKEELTYAHVSSLTESVGPHLAVIKIVDPQKDLATQQWTERSKRNTIYGKDMVAQGKGGGLRRLKIWA